MPARSDIPKAPRQTIVKALEREGIAAEHFNNRELSWLEFNRRVLEEARDPNVPLLERLKFLAIYGSNLDEFFKVRVGGLQQKVHAGIALGSGADRMPPREQLDRIRAAVRQAIGEVHA